MTVDTCGTIPLKERSPEARDAYYEGFNAALAVCAEIADRNGSIASGYGAEGREVAHVIRDNILNRKLYK